MNNKLLTGILILGITTTWFVSLSSADDHGEKWFKWNSEIRELFQKAASGETLTADEQSQVDEAKAAKEAKKAEKQARSELITSLINGETLTADQTALRVDMLTKMEEGSDERKSDRSGKEVIEKLLKWETLSDEDEIALAEMQAKKAERTAAKEAISPILEKKKAGEELTESEEAQLEEFKANHKGKKGFGKKWKRGWDSTGERSDRWERGQR